MPQGDEQMKKTNKLTRLISIISAISGLMMAQWVTVPDGAITIPPNESVTVPIVVDVTDKLPGDYSQFVTVITDDPELEQTEIGVTATVQTKPKIKIITDVPDDQGGWVFIEFYRCYYDDTPLNTRVPENYTIQMDAGNGWVAVQSLSAYAENEYTALVHTTTDSSDVSEGLLNFRVIAAMEEGNWASAVVSGYSVDNIVPTPPSDFLVNVTGDAMDFAWSESGDVDFAYFTVYQNDAIVTHTTEASFSGVSDGSLVPFEFSATDVHGNESARVGAGMQSCFLLGGWNIVSGAMLPFESDMLSVFSDLILQEQLITIIDESGARVQPFMDNWMNQIGDWQDTEGYYVKVTEDCDLLLPGMKVQTPLEIPLTTGWNMMSYPCANPQDAWQAVRPLMESGVLDKVISETGATIFQVVGIWLNTIGEFNLGEGYYIKVTEDCSLTFDEPQMAKNISASFALSAVSKKPEYFQLCIAGNPYQPMAVVITNAEQGSEYAVFDGELCVGAIIATEDEIQVISVTADDPTTNTKDGFSVGNPLKLKVFDGENELETELSFVDSENRETDAQSFQPLGSAFIQVEVILELPTEFGLSQNYPNPFNPMTVIRYQLPVETNGRLSLQIYDIQGRLVETLVDEMQDAGYYSVNFDGSDLSSGVYFYQISVETNGRLSLQETHKMVLMK